MAFKKGKEEKKEEVKDVRKELMMVKDHGHYYTGQKYRVMDDEYKQLVNGGYAKEV